MTEIPEHLRKRAEEAAKKTQKIAKDPEVLRTVADGAKLLKDGQSFLNKIGETLTEIFTPDIINTPPVAPEPPKRHETIIPVDDSFEQYIHTEAELRQLKELTAWRDLAVEAAIEKYRLNIVKMIAEYKNY